MYTLNPYKHEVNNTSIEPTHISLKRKSPSSDKAYLWHLRLGHINSNRIQRLVKDRILDPLVLTHYLVCESSIKGKMTKRPFSAKGNRAKDLLEVVYTNVCGPMSTPVRGGFEYFITFIDDYSRYGYV